MTLDINAGLAMKGTRLAVSLYTISAVAPDLSAGLVLIRPLDYLVMRQLNHFLRQKTRGLIVVTGSVAAQVTSVKTYVREIPFNRLQMC